MKKNIIFIILFIILLLSLGVFGYIQFQNKQLTNMLKPNNNAMVESEEELVAEETIDINNPLINTLYNKYIIDGNLLANNVYQDHIVNSNNIDMNTAILTIFSNIDIQKDSYKNNSSESNITKTYYFKKEKIDSIAKMIFGEKFNLKFNGTLTLMGSRIKFDNNEYIFETFDGGGEIPAMQKRKLLKAEKKDNMLYLYDKYFEISNLEENNGNTKIYARVYSDNSRKDNIYNLTENPDRLYTKEFENEMMNLTKTYKHTFGERPDGTYYWISSEMVK